MPVQEDTVQCVIETGLDGSKTHILTNSNILGRWREGGKSKTMKLAWAGVIILVVVCVMVVAAVETKKTTLAFAAPLPIARPEAPDTKTDQVKEGNGNKKKKYAIDPAESWKAFVRITKRNEQIEQQKKANRKLKSGPIYTQGPPGPPGPRGRRGLRGPKGGNFTKDEIIELMTEVLRQRTTYSQIAAENPQAALNSKCSESCSPNFSLPDGNETEIALSSLYETSETAFVPRISVAFMWELSDDAVVSRKSFIELTKFHRTYAVGDYERYVDEISSETGRFTAPRSGFYTFFVRLHLLLRASDGESISNLGNELFSVLLCINSLCQKNINLETISGFPVGQRTTVSINGMLFLEGSQYVSVFLDNGSRYSIKVFQGSQFSGYISGV